MLVSSQKIRSIDCIVRFHFEFINLCVYTRGLASRSSLGKSSSLRVTQPSLTQEISKKCPVNGLTCTSCASVAFIPFICLSRSSKYVFGGQELQTKNCGQEDFPSTCT